MAKGDEGKILPIRTRVSCHYEGKREVFVAGMFNGWNPKVTPMRRDAKDDWSVDLDLIPGTYEYKFVINGSWCCYPAHNNESHADDCVPNSLGTTNRTLRVE